MIYIPRAQDSKPYIFCAQDSKPYIFHAQDSKQYFSHVQTYTGKNSWLTAAVAYCHCWFALSSSSLRYIMPTYRRWNFEVRGKDILVIREGEEISSVCGLKFGPIKIVTKVKGAAATGTQVNEQVVSIFLAWCQFEISFECMPLCWYSLIHMCDD